jgi:hypothetical protein
MNCLPRQSQAESMTAAGRFTAQAGKAFFRKAEN